MQFAKIRRSARRPDDIVLATHVTATMHRTIRLVESPDGRVRWTCDCDDYRRSEGRRIEPWCKHVAKAAARRSIERMVLARRVTRAVAKT
jgi:hypothetical protein